MKSSYSQLTENTKDAIKENAKRNVEKMREHGKVKPLSFSTLDCEYSEKFHNIFNMLKKEDPTVTKLTAFKIIIDHFMIKVEASDKLDAGIEKK